MYSYYTAYSISGGRFSNRHSRQVPIGALFREVLCIHLLCLIPGVVSRYNPSDSKEGAICTKCNLLLQNQWHLQKFPASTNAGKSSGAV